MSFPGPKISGAARILRYMALSWETGTRKLLEKLLREGKRVALPKVVMDGKNSQEKGPWMVFFEIRSMDDLGRRCLPYSGAWRALSEGRLENSACAGAGHGLYAGRKAAGKGRGGYYDCFLEREPDHETLALAYGFQMVETLPGEEHDRPVDMVITPEQIFFSGRHRGK